jgi:FkbH-like protein
MIGKLPQATLACTFSAGPTLEGLRLALAQHNLNVEVTCAPYGQVAEVLPRIGLAESRADANNVLILVVRPADLIRNERAMLSDKQADPHGQKARRTTADQWIDVLIEGLHLRARMPGGPVIVSVVEDKPSPEACRDSSWLAQAGEAIRGRAAEAGAIVVPFGPLEHDPQLDAIAHLPYPVDSLEQLGRSLALSMWRSLMPQVKVIVFDCDDTLWGGACAELGPAGVDHSGVYNRIQCSAVAQRNKGRLICLASHNAESDVRLVLNRGMGALGEDHVTAMRVSWEDKAVMIAGIANELSLGLDSFVFLDDNPVQRAAVRSALPEVSIPDFSTADELADLLEESWLFDAVLVTDEDRRRAKMYQEASQRRQLADAAMDPEKFIEWLQVNVRADVPSTDDDYARCHQLINRTNQFAHVAPGFSLDSAYRKADNYGPAGKHGRVWILEVSDRIGDYGRIGLLADHLDGEVLHIDALVMSCRVLGRGVEGSIAKLILHDAIRMNAQRVRLELAHTIRNEPIQHFLRVLGGTSKHGKNEMTVLDVDTASLISACPPSHARLSLDPSVP